MTIASQAQPISGPEESAPMVARSNAAEPPGAELAIDLFVAEGVGFLTVSGEVDISTAERLRIAGEHALNAVTGTLRINLADVAFIDSSGLSALVAINNKALATRSLLVLEQPTEQVRRVLAVSGLDQVLRSA